jgi:hypothetical protein
MHYFEVSGTSGSCRIADTRISPVRLGGCRQTLPLENNRGYGMSSVRFICGTQDIHRELENRLTEFLGTEDTLLFPSCMDANAGFFEACLNEQDVMIADRLVHASIVDGMRLCKAMQTRTSTPTWRTWRRNCRSTWTSVRA